MSVAGQNVAPTATRVGGLDLKLGEQLVRRLALHHHLLPCYRLPPPLPLSASSTILSVLNDESCSFDCLPPPIDPSWREHEQKPNSNTNKVDVKAALKGKTKKTNSGPVPAGRASKKRTQLVALLRIITPIILARQRHQQRPNRTSSPIAVVDFCCGCGHVGLLIAAAFPSVSVILVDVKPIALQIAAKRAKAAHLTNVRTVQSTVLDFPPSIECDVAVALHACGDASDDVLRIAIQRQASLIVAPCCVGSLASPGLSSHLGKFGQQQKQRIKSANSNTVTPKSKILSDMVTLDEFGLLARVADFGELSTGKDQWRGIAKMMVEQDRIAGLCEQGYCTKDVMLVKMRPETCTPKNDVLVAWPPQMNSYIDGGVGSMDEESTWCADPRSNGTIIDFQNGSILNGLGIKEVESVERMLRRVVCDPGSPGVYVSSPGGGKRARKIIHAVADGLNLTHESVGRGIERHVIVKRHIHWPLFYDRYIGIAGPYIDTLAQSLISFVPDICVQRKRFLRGDSHHITIISPREAPDLLPEFGGSHKALLRTCYDALAGSKFRILGVGKATKLLMDENDDGIDVCPADAYYVVVEWEEAQTLRQELRLNKCDLHITLGFSDRDLYGVPKDSSTIIHDCDRVCSPWT